MPTPISEFCDPVRFLVGDHFDGERLTDDSAIARGVRVLIKGGQAPARTPAYALTGDQLAITPDVGDPNHYLLIAAKVAKMYMGSQPDRQSYGDRGHREVLGSFRHLDFDLHELIYKLENGAMFDGWQSFASWLEGFAGVRKSWLHLTRLKLQMPFDSVTLTGRG